MEIQSLGHVVLKVRDLDRARAFYAGVLGLEEVARMGDGMLFFSIAGNHHDLALVETGADAPSPPPRAPGPAHVAFKIGDDLDRLREAKRHLEGHGVVIDHLSDHEVSQSVYFHDPDGNMIELFVDGDPALWQSDPTRVATVKPLAI